MHSPTLSASLELAVWMHALHAIRAGRELIPNRFDHSSCKDFHQEGEFAGTSFDVAKLSTMLETSINTPLILSSFAFPVLVVSSINSSLSFFFSSRHLDSASSAWM